MTLDESIQGMRLQVIRRAAEVGVTAACEEAGISRTLFYRWQNKVTLYGVAGLHPRRQHGRPGPRPELPPHAERQILALAIAQATWGCRRLASYLARWWRLSLAPSTVQRLLQRHGLGTRRERLLVLEHHSARQAGLLTERTRRALWRSRHGATRHVAADEPGELVCLDTFYIGNLKGVGKVWQITACDAASSYGVAAILPALTSAAAAAFVRDTLMPLFRRGGWPIRRVLTDGGPEFKRVFDEACAALGIRHTRTKAACLDQRLRGAAAADDPARALAGHFPPSLLHQPRGPAAHAPALHALLQPRAAPSRLPDSGPHAGLDRLRRPRARSLSS